MGKLELLEPLARHYLPRGAADGEVRDLMAGISGYIYQYLGEQPPLPHPPEGVAFSPPRKEGRRMKPKVYIPQEPMRKNGDGRWVSKGLNLAATVEYGEMCIIWGPDTSVLARELLFAEAMKIAEQYDEENDYMVALGSPSLIAVLAWAVGRVGKRMRVLEWDRSLQRYYPTLAGQ
jgi:hypothetical protein